MELFLSVGDVWQLYTTYESIAGEKVRVIGTLAYSEVYKIPYNVTVLAINERVISLQDEDLEQRIGTDSIYHCRSVLPKPDGTYAEYIVWDSIINKEKTIKINKTYQYVINLTVTDTMTSPITQIIADIEKFIINNYANLNFSILKLSETSSSGSSSTSVTATIDDATKYEKADNIINALNRLETKLIPAADAIINGNLIEKTTIIINNMDTILEGVQTISTAIG
jgi:NADPH:quinone reductase-like Zn-dependent oxidoreductase